MDPAFTAQNPIVAAAERIRARRELAKAIDGASDGANEGKPEDAEESLRRFARGLQAGSVRLNAILGARGGAKVVQLERPLRIRLRFGERRVALDLDAVHQLVRVRGLDLDGDYQFDPNAETPALINLSIISTEVGYGAALSPSDLLKAIAAEAELPRPAHLERGGPLSL